MEHTLNTNAHAVLDVLRASQNHPTALEVYESVRRARPRIGLATVYRILHQLTEQGLIKELEYGSECSRYDAHIRRHDHTRYRWRGRGGGCEHPNTDTHCRTPAL